MFAFCCVYMVPLQRLPLVKGDAVRSSRIKEPFHKMSIVYIILVLLPYGSVDSLGSNGWCCDSSRRFQSRDRISSSSRCVETICWPSVWFSIDLKLYICCFAEWSIMNRFIKVMLFEKATFLVIAQAQITQHRDVHRFEKVSNIIKQFKLSCR